MIKKPLVLATRNQGKISEFRDFLSIVDIQIKSLNDFGPIPPIVEDGKSFEDNAYKKAHLTAKMLGFPALADDSGLVVNALGGAPGVHSARYAGEGATDEANNEKLLREMEGVKDRSAAFECVIAIAVPRGPALIYEARCEGEITTRPMGKGGFGYDPVFYYPPLKKTFAQMSKEEKNRVSHRGKALAELRSEFDKVLIWLEQRLAEEPF
ncbi:MAG: XTP/dITP diphosphatase [Deltaproteobacteria bacterium]|nr:XTP/dITP diphosphatase [Deltaproteobacteria bacterium]MBW1978404.1 XTP/dITP diphosphatase [Deltaproteobacteria bacterium]MBW2045635.1 XTP/dITP diphosphatase [Deltaproteobacteria bacterium]MBW2300905.1 XTP/dITP diphosphatase [Deltaproteobacteria bacterium]RLB29213.1 MAG: Non-canonical purine NTP pyrophosphatase [Deltaproteobacteria bacterium]